MALVASCGAERPSGEGLDFSVAAAPNSLLVALRKRGLSWDAHGLHFVDAPSSAPALPAFAELLGIALPMAQNPTSKEACMHGLLLSETGAVFVP